MKILHEIKFHSESNPIKSTELMKICDITSDGIVRKLIHDLRVQGEPIIGTPQGCWYCEDDMKTIKLSESLIQRGISTLVSGYKMREGAIRRINEPDLFTSYQPIEDIIREALNEEKSW